MLFPFAPPRPLPVSTLIFPADLPTSACYLNKYIESFNFNFNLNVKGAVSNAYRHVVMP